MKTLQKIGRKLTKCNVWWFVKANVASWVIQGAIIGLLTLVGVGALASMVSAKVAAWIVFIGQCIQARKGC